MKYSPVPLLPLRNWCSTVLVGICALSCAASLHASTSLEMLAMFDPFGRGHSVETKVPSLASALSEQRYHYNLAKSALHAGKLDDYQQNYELLGDYPLVPYLDYTYLRARLSRLPYAEVDAFLASYPDSFLSVRLRQLWLAQLAARKQWQPYINYYHAEAATTELRCHYLYARVQTGDDSALDEAPVLWNVGDSQPKACDPLFHHLRKSGDLTQDLVWSRFTKAMDKRNLGLARYLAASLTGNHQRMAQLYLQVDQQPGLMKQHNRFRQQDPLMQQIIAHGVSRLARRDAKAALREWELYEAQQLFSEDLSRDTKITLVRYLTRQDHPAEAEQMLRTSAALRQSDVVEELIREALRSLDWAAVARRIQMLPVEEQAADRWQYWRARAMSELDIASPDVPAPADVYATLAGKRSFYGFLAADLLGREYSLEEAPVEVNPGALRSIADLPGMRRAKELWLVGNPEEARAEWLFTIERMSREQLVSAGQLARQWGWYNKGIHAMITGDLWDHLSIRFPLAYQEVVTRVASTMQLDPTLIYAIARQESAFAENARSSAGARGLMQLMPATAAQEARNKGVPHSVQDLYNPEHNIMLGSSYFHSLLERFDNNRILATAAYNAGPHRVARWISAPDKERPFDVWIETIPFRETRGYVQNVLSYSVIYGYRMGQTTHLVTEKEAGDLL